MFSKLSTFLFKAIKYTRVRLRRDPLYFIAFVVQYCNPRFKLNIPYLSHDEVAKRVATGASLIRYGDGEFYLMTGGSLPDQPYSDQLEKLLRDSIREVTDKSPYVCCLNRVPMSKTNTQLRKAGLLICWLPSKVYFWLYGNRKVSYGDAAMFYFRDTMPTYFESYLRAKHIVFAANNDTINLLKTNKDMPFLSTSYVVTPKSNAFSVYDKIKADILAAIAASNRTDVVVVATFGPALKAMAYEFAKIGIQVIDVGQGITSLYTSTDHIMGDTIRNLAK